eukprot:743340-Amphidinium_carterae.1
MPTCHEHPLRPVMEEEYHNKLVVEWVKRNQLRRPKTPAVPQTQSNDPASREIIWRAKKMKLIVKERNAGVGARKKRNAEEQDKIRKMNEQVNLSHLAEGLKLSHMAEHDAKPTL